MLGAPLGALRTHYDYNNLIIHVIKAEPHGSRDYLELEQMSEVQGRGYFPIPRQLWLDLRSAGINTIRLMGFLVNETFGWEQSRWVALSYDDIQKGRKWADGSRSDASGVPNDAAISKAIADALANHMIEIRYLHGQTFYAVHKRYWVDAKLKPTWALFRRIPYDEKADPLIEEAPASQGIAASDNQPTIAGEAAMPRLAASYPEDSSLLSPEEQPVIFSISGTPDEARQEAEPRKIKESVIESNKIEKQERKGAFTEREEEQEEKTIREPDTQHSPSSSKGNTMGTEATRQAEKGPGRDTGRQPEASGLAERWWNRVKEDMKAFTTPTTWQSWFPGTKGLRLEGDTLVVHAKSGAQDQFEHRFQRDIAAILRGAARPGIKIRYTQEEG